MTSVTLQGQNVSASSYKRKFGSVVYMLQSYELFSIPQNFSREKTTGMVRYESGKIVALPAPTLIISELRRFSCTESCTANYKVAPQTTVPDFVHVAGTVSPSSLD